MSLTNLHLNLGCGTRLLDGFINVDKFGEPDMLFDLETFPWPWQDNSVTLIELRHALEHLGQQTPIFLKIIQEIYRVCEHGAQVHVVVPHHRHDNLAHDPTHVRPITPKGLSMFSKRLNQEWKAQGKAATLLAIYLDVNFELVEVKQVPGDAWYRRYPGRTEDMELLLAESEVYNNLIKEVVMTLSVVK